MVKLADLESDLKLRFPGAFQDDIAPQFTFRCGEGWFAIVATLCSLISEANGHLDQAPTHLLSVVEKLGTLRIFVAGRNSHVNDWIKYAERHALHTCEICGGSGKLLYIDGWQRVRCEPHKLCIREFDAD